MQLYELRGIAVERERHAFGMSGTADLATQHDKPEDLNLEKYCCDNPKFGSQWASGTVHVNYGKKVSSKLNLGCQCS
jgi:hypothetical protein